MKRSTRTMAVCRAVAGIVVLPVLLAGTCLALEKEKSLVTGELIGELAVAGKLDVDLHAEFMVSRTFDKDTALNWYNCGLSGGGSNNKAGGTFGDFGMHVHHTKRDEAYPHCVSTPESRAVSFDGNDIMKANFAVEAAAAGNEDMAIEVWVRDDSPSRGEVIFGWQSEDGRETSAPMSYPARFRGSKKWRHVIVNCAADKETWYLDGRKVSSGRRRMVIKNGHRMVLGGESAAKPSFKGELAVVRLHEEAMSEREIAHNFKGGVMLGTELHSWWRNEKDKWWCKESKHFRHCVDIKEEMSKWDKKRKERFLERVPKMFELAEKLYHLYGERLALRMALVSRNPELRGDGIKYKTPIQPAKGSWMGWNKKLGFGYCLQGAGHINPHELVHGCQGQTGAGMQGNYWEAHANFPQTYAGIYQTVPPTFCSRVSMFFPGNGRVYYHARTMFEHLAQTPEYGPMFISKLWYDGGTPEEKHEYPWKAFTRLDPDPSTPLPYEWTRMVQRCVTWDYETFDEKRPDLYKKDAARHMDQILRYGRTLLERIPFEKGWWRAPPEMAPQQLGWNICPLKATSREVSVELSGYINKERGSDWRAAFVGVNAAGKPRYGKITGVGKKLRFSVQDAKELYLVVAATPTKIMGIPQIWKGDFRSPQRHQFPYKVRLGGCEPLDVLIPKKPDVPGRAHPNGGGFVANTAKVDPTAYVGPNAQVLGKAKVLGHARVEGYAVVKDNATVRDHARVSGHALVYGRAVVRDHAKVRDFAKTRVTVKDFAKMLEHALDGKEISGHAVMKGVACGRGGKIGGTGMVDGSYSKTNNISKGVWLTWNWSGGKNPGEIDKDLGGLYAQYKFEKQHPYLAWDTYGVTHGYLVGEPKIVGSALSLNGRDQWVELHKDVADMHDITIDITFKWTGSARNQRIIECSRDERTKMYLTPADRSGKPAFVITKRGVTQTLQGGLAAPRRASTSIKVVLAGDTGKLYVNGKLAAKNDRMTLNPDDVAATTCFLGRGLGGDFFAGTLDEVSIYSLATED